MTALALYALLATAPIALLPIIPLLPFLSGERIEPALITHVRLVSPERNAVLEDAWVTIAGGRIVEVGSGTPPEREPALTFDGKNRYLTPGLIDGHVHLASPLAMTLPMAEAYPELIKAYRRQLPRSFLYFGYTTVVDLNGLREVTDEIAAAPIGPDVLDCDGALGLFGGYPTVYVDHRQMPRFFRNVLLDPNREVPPGLDAERQTPLAGVGRVHEAGGVAVKIFFERGFGEKRGLPVISPELASEVIAASHERELPVILHANGFEGHVFGLEMGVDMLAHGMWNWERFDGQSGLPEPIRNVVDAMAIEGIGVMSTLQVIGGLQLLFDEEFLDDPRLAAVVPAEMLAWFGSQEGQWFAREMRAESGQERSVGEIRAQQAATLSQGARTSKRLVDQGGRLLFGSDTPSAPTYANAPGLNGFLEMQRLAQAGISAQAILRAATLENARAFGVQDRFGTITPGKIANLVLLEANPLESVAAWDSITTVIVHGALYERNQLAAGAGG